MQIAPVTRQTAHQSVIGSIQNYIVEQGLQPGDRLPTEQEFCDSLGISRSIVRESLSHFRMLGIITSKPRVGTVISEFLPKDAFASYQVFMAGDKETYREAKELRMSLEIGAIPLMIRGYTPEVGARLSKVLETMAIRAQTVGSDIEFHRILLESTRNRLISSLIPVTVQFFFSFGVTPVSDAQNAAPLEYHRSIAAALAAGDGDRMSEEFRRHYAPITPGYE